MKYAVIIDRPAQEDIANTIMYIRNTLYAEKAANDFYSELKQKVNALSDFPKQYALIAEKNMRFWE